MILQTTGLTMRRNDSAEKSFLGIMDEKGITYISWAGRQQIIKTLMKSIVCCENVDYFGIYIWIELIFEIYICCGALKRKLEGLNINPPRINGYLVNSWLDE